MAVMGNGEILQFAFAQFLANRGPMPGAMQIQPQQIGLTALPLSGFTGLLVTAGAPMPTLALHLLPQVILELKRQASLAATEALRHPLEVVGAHSGLGQFAQQPHQGSDRLLELVGPAEIALLQHLLDLPIQPEGGLIEQSAVIASPVLLEELIGVLA